jgi:hypothetical protein
MQHVLYDKFTELFDRIMGIHPTIKKSFFIRILLITAFLGNVYLGLQALAHSLHFHTLDLALRWYAFKSNQFIHILLLLGALFTLAGLRRIFKIGLPGFRLYASGKLITTCAYALLIFFEYRISNVPLPLILFPVLIAIQSVYPILLYISLRKSKAKTAC